MKMIDLYIPKGAIFSDDRKYRYALWRSWSSIRQPLLFVGLNPSTANEITDDATITRNTARSSQNGFGGLLMANLYAYVSTNPADLLKDGQGIGQENDDYLNQMIKMAGRVVCCWGSFREAQKRADIVLKMIPEPYCLGVNADGQPKHPLYISYHTPMVKYVQGKVRR
jgi:hypothetical protein